MLKKICDDAFAKFGAKLRQKSDKSNFLRDLGEKMRFGMGFVVYFLGILCRFAKWIVVFRCWVWSYY